jgi:hypothetical protein
LSIAERRIIITPNAQGLILSHRAAGTRRAKNFIRSQSEIAVGASIVAISSAQTQLVEEMSNSKTVKIYFILFFISKY